jgi:hypothetical protein
MMLSLFQLAFDWIGLRRFNFVTHYKKIATKSSGHQNRLEVRSKVIEL